MVNKMCNNNSNYVVDIKEEFILPSIILDEERNSISKLFINQKTVKLYSLSLFLKSTAVPLPNV